MSATAETAYDRPAGFRPNLTVVLVAGAVLLIGAGALYDAFAWRQATLYLIGAALGLVLYHAMFGFTSAWRVFLADRRGAGLRAQMLMLAVATLLFFPALADGSLFGRQVGGAVAPVGLSVAVGAFLFGIGMQLGGGCASPELRARSGDNALDFVCDIDEFWRCGGRRLK